jgi:hypothetical protein
VRQTVCELLADCGVIARELQEDLAIVIQTLQDDAGTVYAPGDGLLDQAPATDFTVEVPVGTGISGD